MKVYQTLRLIFHIVILNALVSISRCADLFGNSTWFDSNLIELRKNNITTSNLMFSSIETLLANCTNVLRLLKDYNQHQLISCSIGSSVVGVRQYPNKLICELLAFDLQSKYYQFMCSQNLPKLCASRSYCAFNKFTKQAACKCDFNNNGRYCLIDTTTYNLTVSFLSITGKTLRNYNIREIDFDSDTKFDKLINLLNLVVPFVDNLIENDEITIREDYKSIYDTLFKLPPGNDWATRFKSVEYIGNRTIDFISNTLDYIHRLNYMNYNRLLNIYGNKGVFQSTFFEYYYGKQVKNVVNLINLANNTGSSVATLPKVETNSSSSVNGTIQNEMVYRLSFSEFVNGTINNLTNSVSSKVAMFPEVFIPGSITNALWTNTANNQFYITFFSNPALFLNKMSPNIISQVIGISVRNSNIGQINGKSNVNLEYPLMKIPITISASWAHFHVVNLLDELNYEDFCSVFEFNEDYNLWIASSLSNVNRKSNNNTVFIDIYKFGVYGVACDFVDYLTITS